MLGMDVSNHHDVPKHVIADIREPMTWAMNIERGGILVYCPSFKSWRNKRELCKLLVPYILKHKLATGFPGNK
jgi:hypothetical protein